MGEKVVSIAALIVGVAMVAVLVQSNNTAPVISSAGTAFSNAVTSAMGQVGRK